MAKVIHGNLKTQKLIRLNAKNNLPILIIGETGTGKTSMVRAEAEKQGKELIRFNLNGETSVDEFVGKFILVNGETVWQDGVLLQAMKKGKWLLVDEVNAALPEILFTLHSLMDDDKSILVAGNTGEVVKAHEDFRLFATMNPTEEYAGTKDLNKAFLSRFPLVVRVTYPSEIAESAIIRDETGIDEESATKMVLIANKIRKLKEKKECYFTCSTRELIAWGYAEEELGFQDAFRYCILEKAEQVEHQAIENAYNEVSNKVAEFHREVSKDTFSFDVLEAKLKELQDAKIRIEALKEHIGTEFIETLSGRMKKELQSFLAQSKKEKTKT